MYRPLRIALVLAGVLWIPAFSRADGDRPVPPCAAAPVHPPYPDTGAPPVVRVWSGEEAKRVTLPPCTGWQETKATAVVALAGRFVRDGDSGELLSRLAHVSELTGIRYWSVTRGDWAPLFHSATALTGPDGSPRPDFSTSALASGQPFYLRAEERALGGTVEYRGQVIDLAPDRLTVELSNTDRQYVLFVPVLGPGDYRQLYYFLREDGNVWRYYSLLRIRSDLLTSPALPGSAEPDKSLINRAVALYRHFSGQPTDESPPAAP